MHHRDHALHENSSAIYVYLSDLKCGYVAYIPKYNMMKRRLKMEQDLCKDIMNEGSKKEMCLFQNTLL